MFNATKVTKEMIIADLMIKKLSKNQVNDYLDILIQLDRGILIYDIETDTGWYYLFIESSMMNKIAPYNRRKKLSSR